MDIGAEEIYVAVPADRDEQPVQSFGTFTGELCHWLKHCGIETVAMGATGVYWPEDGRFRLPMATASSFGRIVARIVSSGAGGLCAEIVSASPR
jgi:hypothetical protein